MLDIKAIQANPQEFQQGAIDKGYNPQDIDKALSLYQTRLSLLRTVEQLRAQQNETAATIATLQGEEKTAAIKATQTNKQALKEYEAELKNLDHQFQEIMLQLPAPAMKKVPVGKTDEDNVPIKTWGDIPHFNFEAKDHVQLGKELDIIDIPRGVKISGSRFYFLKNDGALLELAVLRYTLDKLVKKGFSAFIPPVLVKHEAMTGTSYFPGGEEQAYAIGVKSGKDAQIEDDNMYLVGTSEVSVASYHSGETLKENELPKLYAGISNCFRREAGTYGKDTHGLYRIHQFQKVEQVVICKNDPEESARLHDIILQNAEEVLQDLQLPYRVVDVCTGDMGQGQVYKNDIETWMPSRESYGETHSCSTFYDFQSRRLQLKYTDEQGNKQFCHTLNNTCIASPRVLIPLLEVHQQEDGSILIPEVLRPYMLGKTHIKPQEK